jgi:LysM repeat protein
MGARGRRSYKDNINSSIPIDSIPRDTTDDDSTEFLPGDLPPAQKMALAAQGETWEVEAGDTLSSIAKDMGVSLESLVLHNKITNPNIIKPGQFIYKPPVTPDVQIGRITARMDEKPYGEYEYTVPVPDADAVITEYSSNLQSFEGNYGNASFIHKPSTGSGITIAHGLDAIGTSRAVMASLGVPKRILEQMDTLDAWGKGEDAVIPKDLVLERMTPAEFDNVSRNQAERGRGQAQYFKTHYPQLSDKGIAILLNLEHWAGSYKSSKEGKLTRHKDNIEKGTAVATGGLVSPIADALLDISVTDDDLVKAMKTIRNSYVPWGKGVESHRYKTLTKYIANINE